MTEEHRVYRSQIHDIICITPSFAIKFGSIPSSSTRHRVKAEERRKVVRQNRRREVTTRAGSRLSLPSGSMKRHNAVEEAAAQHALHQKRNDIQALIPEFQNIGGECPDLVLLLWALLSFIFCNPFIQGYLEIAVRIENKRA